ncbi:MAG TPA: M28 family peptidase [Candidatus Thermoplasmatota archaeon]|nr:M28 family peptidase [Candidatus Thermoplasmatota archaeon]
MRSLAVGLAVALLAAGCLGLPSSDDTRAPRAGAAVLPDLSDLQPPQVDATRARLWWEDFVMNTPYRHAGTPTNIEASERLLADLEAAGYDARIFYYVPPQVRGVPIPVSGESPIEGGIRTVVGVKKGSTLPEQVVAWVAHYDSHQATVYAAYDDGSGTAVALELARTLASYNNSKTLMPIFFDAEEIGLVASEAFVQQAMRDARYRFDLVIGHDMTGINCPGHEWPMYQMVGENFAERLLPIQEALYRDVMKVNYTTASLDTPTAEIPPACVVILDGHDRNSDERNFKEENIPILRMAGGRKAADYPAYHLPNDTVEFVYEFAGGAENYEKGLRLTVEASWWNAVIFDRLPSLVG